MYISPVGSSTMAGEMKFALLGMYPKAFVVFGMLKSVQSGWISK
jgi:hypothetical protein